MSRFLTFSAGLLLALAPVSALKFYPGEGKLTRRNESKDTLIIVRTHKPSDFMKERMVRMAEDVADNLPSAHMLVSIDDTGLAPRLRLSLPLPDLSVHRYNWADVERANKQIPWAEITPRPDGRFYHLEPIVMATEYVELNVPMARDFNVWVMEDDVLVCGSFSEIVKQYATNKADVLTGEGIYVGDWPNRYWASPAFDARYPMEKRAAAFEFVERFSRRFLDRAAYLSRVEGVTSLSEMLVPTICQQEGFEHGYYQAEHMGYWDWDAHMNPREAATVCASQRNIINHAAKFMLPMEGGVLRRKESNA